MRDYSYKKIEPQTQTLVEDNNRNITEYYTNNVFKTPGRYDVQVKTWMVWWMVGWVIDYHEDPAGSSITIIMSNTLTHTAREDKSSLSCVLCYGSTEKELPQ